MTSVTGAASRTVRLGGYALCVGVGLLLLAASPEGRAGQATTHSPPETFHWVLPAQYPEVEVTELHPGDCYVIQQVEGMVYFGDPVPDTLELQRALGEPRDVTTLSESALRMLLD